MNHTMMQTPVWETELCEYLDERERSDAWHVEFDAYCAAHGIDSIESAILADLVPIREIEEMRDRLLHRADRLRNALNNACALNNARYERVHVYAGSHRPFERINADGARERLADDEPVNGVTRGRQDQRHALARRLAKALTSAEKAAFRAWEALNKAKVAPAA